MSVYVYVCGIGGGEVGGSGLGGACKRIMALYFHTYIGKFHHTGKPQMIKCSDVKKSAKQGKKKIKKNCWRELLAHRSRCFTL